MANIDVTITTPTALSTDSPNSVIQLTFKYSGTTTASNAQIYYSASLNDGTHTEDVVIPYTIAGGGPSYSIPTTDQPFAFTPKTLTGDTVTLVANSGAIFYTA